MKTKFLIFAIALFSYTFVNGQDYYKDLDKKARAYTDQMVTDLDLTENQESIIQRANVVWIEQQLRYNELENITDEQKGYMESMRLDYINKVTNALTDDQRVNFKAWVQETKLLKY